MFLLLLLSSTGMILSAVSAILLATAGAYNTSSDYVRDDVIGSLLKDPIRSEVERYFFDTGLTTQGAVDVRICKEDGTLLFETENSDLSVDDGRKTYEYYLWAVRRGDDRTPYHFDLCRSKDERLFYDEDYVSGEEDVSYSSERYLLSARINTANKSIYSIGESLVVTGYQYRYTLLGVLGGFLLVSVILYVFWVSVCGRRPGTDEITETSIDRIPMDLFLFLIGTAGFLVFSGMAGVLFGFMEYSPEIAIPLEILGTMLLYVLFLLLSASTVVRIRAGKLFYNTTIAFLFRQVFRFCKWVISVFRELRNGIPFFPKTVAGIIGLGLLDIIWYVVLFAVIISADDESYMLFVVFLMCLVKALVVLTVIPFYLSGRYAMARILRYCSELAAGDFSPKSETGLGINGDLKKAGADLNSISEGMNMEMERRMKSERMKTELITNVSHDLKTPLTSIINYSDLIRRECDGTSDLTVIREYSEVLTRQSGKLKRLIEDLVEASKASSGVLDVEMSPCDGNVLLIQSEGEYEERFNEAGLEVVLQTPEEELPMMADPRRMWRVFENLYGNICKYSLKGSRVYLTAKKEGDKVRFIFRNISSDALDISPEELMERFVRGDRSRNSEGNGLGLSIARSMTELQKGTMKIEIDGDFFKVILDFPLIKTEEITAEDIPAIEEKGEPI